MFDDMSLAELFAVADKIGDKYLTPEEIEQRDTELRHTLAALEESIGTCD